MKRLPYISILFFLCFAGCGKSEQKGDEVITVWVRIIENDTIHVQTDLVDEDSGLRGHLMREVHPGESLWGIPYDKWKSMGTGEHQLDPRSLDGNDKNDEAP